MGLGGRAHAWRRLTSIASAAALLLCIVVHEMPSSDAANSAQAFGWGNNASGELADGTTTSPRLTPVPMTGLAEATAMSVGFVHGLAVVGGSVLSWGHNRSGQLGDGTTVDHATPAPVAGLSGVAEVAAGDAFSLATLTNGTVLAWGNNRSGELGDGSAPTDQHTPVQVAGLGAGSGVVAVAAGESHALALLADGTVLAWGHNASGELGDGSAPTDHHTPVPVAGLGAGSGVVAIAAGGTFSLALRADGTVLAWGNNQSGELGDGSAPTDHATPVPVAGLGPGSNVIAIVAGGASSYALKSDGTVLAWGNNRSGELGDGAAPADQHVPETVPGLAGIVDIAAGQSHAIAAEASGAVVSWGDNALGQLGDGTTTRRVTPVPVLNLGAGSGVTAVFAAGNHSHALTGTFGDEARAASPGTAAVPAAFAAEVSAAHGSAAAVGSSTAPAAQPVTATPAMTG
jgi:alpha-tubulin suppressor-like RCC1 family protein